MPTKAEFKSEKRKKEKKSYRISEKAFLLSACKSESNRNEKLTEREKNVKISKAKSPKMYRI